MPELPIGPSRAGVFLALLALCLPGLVMSETITREEAIEIVVEEVIAPATLDHDVMAFLTAEPLAAGDRIAPLGFPRQTETLASPAWFAWIDDEPDAEFAHPTRFVFIDAETGAHRVFEKEWSPVLNDTEVLWRQFEDWRPDRGLIFARPEPEAGEEPTRPEGP